MNAYDRLTKVTDRVEAGVAEIQGQLVLAAGTETPVALITSGEIGVLVLLSRMNFRMNFQYGHENSPLNEGQACCQSFSASIAEIKGLRERCFARAV
jgi:hypothetical protein